MIDGTYLFLIGIIYVIWVAVCLIYGSTWQLPLAFVPIAIGSYLYFDTNEWAWLLGLPLLSIFVADLNIVLSKPKFKGWVAYFNYLLILPFIVLFLLNFKTMVKNDSLFSSIYSFVAYFSIIFFASKFWVSDVLLLAINRLYSLEKNSFETAITHRYSEKTGRYMSYYCIIDYVGTIETSGFFYLYVGLKNIDAKDKLILTRKKGCLGIEYISGFPKIIARSSG